MSLTTAHGNNLMKLLFAGTTWNLIAENDSTSPATSYYISLHTASPGVAGDQTTNEASYTGYARIAVARNSGGWTPGSGLTTDNAAAIGGTGAWDCTAGSATVTHVGIGSDSSGAGNLFLFGALTASLAVSAGIDPTFAIGALDVVAS